MIRRVLLFIFDKARVTVYVDKARVTVYVEAVKVLQRFQ